MSQYSVHQLVYFTGHTADDLRSFIADWTTAMLYWLKQLMIRLLDETSMTLFSA